MQANPANQLGREACVKQCRQFAQTAEKALINGDAPRERRILFHHI